MFTFHLLYHVGVFIGPPPAAAGYVALARATDLPRWAQRVVRIRWLR